MALPESFNYASMKYCFLFLLIFFLQINYAQDSLGYYNNQITLNYNQNKTQKTDILFQKKLNYLKNQDNLEEYFYTYFDYFMLNAIADRISILSNTTQNKWRESKTNDEKIAELHLKINIGYHYLKFGNVSKSVIAYEEALHYYQKAAIKNYDIIEYCLKPLANNYTRLGDYSHADVIFKYTLQLAEKTNNKSQLIATYLNLSIQYQSINKNKEALSILEKALQIKSISAKQKGSLLSEIGKNHYQLKNYSKALKYVNKLNNSLNDNILQKNYATAGLCYFEQKEYIKAEASFENSLKLATKIYAANNREIAKIYNQLAAVYSQKKEYLKAQNFYQKALQIILIKYKPKTIYENPEVKNFYAENSIKEALDGRALVFTKQNDFQHAITNYNLAFKVGKLLQNTYTSQQSKIRQQVENRERSEKTVELYYLLYENSKSQEYINLAFENAEKSKATVLLNIMNNNHLKNSIKEDSLFQIEKKLIQEKAILTKNINIEELKNDKANLENLKSYISKKTKTTTKLQVLKQEIYKKYPFLNVIIKPSTAKEIQQDLLFKNQNLIEFFDTKNHLYIFSISKNKNINLRRFSKDSLYNQSLQHFISLFANGNDDKLKNDISAYQNNAYYLYEKLLQPELTGFESNTLTIIPDGRLNFLAFDALLTKQTKATNFEKLPYLLFQNNINYGYSSTILMQQKLQASLNSKQKTIIGFFPVFENNYRNLQELAYTLNEESELKKFTKGLYFEKEKATKNMFLKRINDFDIIHLSTHASAGTFFEPAHIEFRNKTLYLPEIYGLNLNTNLLVMSACETGVGKFQKGEGVMSLARGFSYAGVKNLMVSLWKVNDKATSILMRNFYKNYKNSNNKINALHQAKIDYLTNKNISNTKKSPYYWSSFVFIGNIEPNTSSNFNIYIFLSLILITLIILYFVRIKTI